jgi:hypothetical protein
MHHNIHYHYSMFKETLISYTLLWIISSSNWNFHVTFIFLFIMSEYNGVKKNMCNLSNNTSHYWFFGLPNLQQSFLYNLYIFSILFLSSLVTQYQITLLHTRSNLQPPTSSIVSPFDSFTSLLTIHLILFSFSIYLKHMCDEYTHTHTHTHERCLSDTISVKTLTQRVSHIESFTTLYKSRIISFER